MVSFPDTSINALAMLFVAVGVASLISMGLQSQLGNPESTSLVQFLIGAVAFLVGFGVVYGWAFYSGYRSIGD